MSSFFCFRFTFLEELELELELELETIANRTNRARWLPT